MIHLKNNKSSIFKTKRLISLIAIVLVLSILSGCSILPDKKQPGPEVGKWYGEVNISNLNLTDEDRVIVSLIAGDIAYEMDAEFCEDYTYSYVMNMDKFRAEIQKSATTIVGYLFSFNIDLFVDRIVDLVLDSMGATERSSYGTYSIDENGLITAVGSDTQYFKFISGTLHQLNENGEVILTFTKEA